MEIVNVMAVSLDGKIASHPLESDQQRRSYNFTNPDDQAHVREQILQADAIITGANSMRASGGCWDVTNSRGKYPLWVVMTTKGLAADLRFWQQHHIPRMVVGQTAPSIPVGHSSDNVTCLGYGSQKPAKFVVDQLRSQGAQRVLLFGGGDVNKIFYEENLVDQLKLTLSPFIIGGNSAAHFVNQGLSTPKALRLTSSQVRGSHVFLNYTVQK